MTLHVFRYTGRTLELSASVVSTPRVIDLRRKPARCHVASRVINNAEASFPSHEHTQSGTTEPRIPGIGYKDGVNTILGPDLTSCHACQQVY